MQEREFLARYFAMSKPQKTMVRTLMIVGIVPVMVISYLIELTHGLHLAFRTARLAALEELQSFRRISRMTRPGKRP